MRIKIIGAIATLGILLGLLIVIVQPALATTAECFGQPATFLATVPSSVVSGQNFTISGLTVNGSFAGVTVTESTLALDITNASQASASGQWTGSSTGNYTATYPDVTLKATGGVGSTIIVKLNSMQTSGTLGGNPFSVTCSVGDNSLSAGGAGESLTLGTINIVAATSPSGGGSSSSSQSATSTKSSSGSSTSSTTGSQTNGPTTNTSASNQSAGDSTLSNKPSSARYLTIFVKNSKGQPIVGAKVAIDNLPAVYTNPGGGANFKNVAGGSHTVRVTYGGKTITHPVHINTKNASLLVPVQLPGKKMSIVVFYAAIGGAVIITLVAATFLIMRHRHRRLTDTGVQA